MFADQFIQIAAYISSSNVYGIGENAQMQLRVSIIDEKKKCHVKSWRCYFSIFMLIGFIPSDFIFLSIYGIGCSYVGKIFPNKRRLIPALIP